MPWDWETGQFVLNPDCDPMDCICNKCWEDFTTLGIIVPLYLGFVSICYGLCFVYSAYLCWTQTSSTIRITAAHIMTLCFVVIFACIVQVNMEALFVSQVMIRLPNLIIISTLAFCSIQWRQVVRKVENVSMTIDEDYPQLFRQASVPIVCAVVLAILYVINFYFNSPSEFYVVLNVASLFVVVVFLCAQLWFGKLLTELLNQHQFNSAVAKIRTTVRGSSASAIIALVAVIFNMLFYSYPWQHYLFYTGVRVAELTFTSFILWSVSGKKKQARSGTISTTAPVMSQGNARTGSIGNSSSPAHPITGQTTTTPFSEKRDDAVVRNISNPIEHSSSRVSKSSSSRSKSFVSSKLSGFSQNAFRRSQDDLCEGLLLQPSESFHRGNQE